MAEAESGETDAVTAAGSESEPGGVAPSVRALGYLRGTTYALGTLLVLALSMTNTRGAATSRSRVSAISACSRNRSGLRMW